MFKTLIYHPQIESDEKLALDILQEGDGDDSDDENKNWTTTTQLKDVLL